MSILKRFLVEESGQDTAEYALIIAGVSLAVMVGAVILGGAVSDWYEALAGSVATMASTAP